MISAVLDLSITPISIQYQHLCLMLAQSALTALLYPPGYEAPTLGLPPRRSKGHQRACGVLKPPLAHCGSHDSSVGQWSCNFVAG